MIQNYDACLECNEAIYNPLCHVCLSQEIKQWLREQENQRIRKSLIAEISRFLKSNEELAESPQAVRCVACGKNSVILCPYCFTEIIYKKLKSLTNSKKLQADFLSLFNFDFEHTGYTKDAEELGML